MTRRVLVTGAAGFAGAHLVEHILATTDWDVVALDGLTYAGRVDRLTDMDGYDPARVTLLWHDLRAPIHDPLDRRIGDVDAVLNLAAESHVDRSIADPRPFVENNVGVALTMLEWARRRPQLGHFVQVSTDEVYGPAAPGQAHREWSPIIPSNPYSASKAAQEAVAISYWRTFRLPLVITNTMNLFGERQHVEKFVPKTIRAISAGEPVTLHGRPGVMVHIGKRQEPGAWEPSSRHWLHARNHADALCWLVANTTPAPFGVEDRPDRYNVAGDEETVVGVAAMIAQALGRSSYRYDWVDFHSTRPGHDPRYALDATLIRALGWKPPIGLHESLDRTVRWSVDHPDWLRE